MLLFFLALFILIALNLYWFLSRSFSPIPYFPTNKKDLNLIIRTLDLKKNDVLYDLGAGDGILVIKAAAKAPLGAQIKALEVHPLLVIIMKIKRLFLPKKKNLSIFMQNLFQADLSTATKIYLYVGPFVMAKILEKINTENPKKLRRIVSYMYPFQLKNFLPDRSYSIKTIKGYKQIYIMDID